MVQNSDSPTTHTQLTLFLPGILGAPGNSDESAGSFRALETLLARAERKVHAVPAGYDEALFAQFGLHKEENADLPVAAVTRMLDMGVIDNDWWLRADPVHLTLAHDRLILADAQKLNITREEANRLVAEIMDVFTADGWLLKAPRPERWYLKPAQIPKITTTSLTQVVGRDIHPFLPRGPDGKAWHTTLNEIQILLHTTTVNSERERNGKLPINSLWFWGGGRLPRITPVSWTQVWSDEPVSLSLARLSGTSGENAPKGFNDWYERADKPGEHFIVLDEIHGAPVYENAGLRNDSLQRLEENWMQPLLQALKTGVIASASLVTDSGMYFSITSRQARRWWRFRRPLAAYRAAHH